jgi:hypothetical protein
VLNKITDITKIIIFASAVIIICGMCALGFKMMSEGKSAINNGTNQFNTMATDYNDINLSSYDRSNISGSEVTNLIAKTIEKNSALAIRVTTKAGTPDATTTYNREVTGTAPNLTIGDTQIETSIPTETTANNYINPAAQFYGKVYKNPNGIIILIEFTQQ